MSAELFDQNGFQINFFQCTIHFGLGYCSDFTKMQISHTKQQWKRKFTMFFLHLFLIFEIFIVNRNRCYKCSVMKCRSFFLDEEQCKIAIIGTHAYSHSPYETRKKNTLNGSFTHHANAYYTYSYVWSNSQNIYVLSPRSARNKNKFYDFPFSTFSSASTHQYTAWETCLQQTHGCYTRRLLSLLEEVHAICIQHHCYIRLCCMYTYVLYSMLCYEYLSHWL